MNTPTRTQIAAMQALPAAIKRENDAYTQGLLIVASNSTGDNRMLISPHRIPMVAETYGDCAKANARRLAACWNACAGVPTETLELAGSWDGVLSAVMAGACIDTPEQGEHL